MGWKNENDILVPIFMLLPPVPESCLEIISCECKTGCRTMRCTGRKSKKSVNVNKKKVYVVLN